MRTTGSTVISRDSIAWPSMEGGFKREMKEGPSAPLPCKAPLSSKPLLRQPGGFEGLRLAHVELHVSGQAVLECADPRDLP
jgi:hypothetical protein